MLIKHFTIRRSHRQSRDGPHLRSRGYRHRHHRNPRSQFGRRCHHQHHLQFKLLFKIHPLTKSI